MTLRLWKGPHHSELSALLKQTWEAEDLLLLLPSLLGDFSFVSQLPSGEILFCGEWSESEKTSLMQMVRQEPTYPKKPVLGLFTSGSVAGAPKLVLYSKENIEFALKGVMDFFDTSSINHIFCYPQPFHTFGLLLGYTLAYLNKWKFTALEGKYSSHFHETWLNQVGEKTLTLGTPTHFKDLLQYCAERNILPKSSYSCIVGGAPVSPQLWQNIKEHLGIQKPSIGYGATEASPALTHLPPGQMPLSSGDVGYPLKNIRMDLLPSGGFEFTGPNLCLAIVQNQRLQFPDRMEIKDELKKNADGSFSFMGRSDFVLNRGGEKFLLEELESYLLEELKIATIAMSVPDQRLGENLALLFESGADISPGKILTALHKRYQISFDADLFIAVNVLPLNGAGKKDRFQSLKMMEEARL